MRFLFLRRTTTPWWMVVVSAVCLGLAFLGGVLPSAVLDDDDDDDHGNSGSVFRGGGEKLLYTVTTSAEYDKETGVDRLKGRLIPVVKQGVRSMVNEGGYHVDVYIISYYPMTRRSLVVSAIQSVSPNTTVRFWDEAAPLAYNAEHRRALFDYDVALSRQHRFVVKDHLFDYDLFLNFEDDMVLTAPLVTNYLELTAQLETLRASTSQNYSGVISKKQNKQFYGPLTREQLKRTYPGLIRVEVLLNDTLVRRSSPEKRYGAVPLPEDYNDDSSSSIDPSFCCHLHEDVVDKTRPRAPSIDKTYLWETNILALGVRRFTNHLGWMALLRGPSSRDPAVRNTTLSDFWSGTKGYFGTNRRPQSNEFRFLNNGGGWMGTRKQIWEWHTEICEGGFLPPFDPPFYNRDGLDGRNVEYWSGGMNLFTKKYGCNLQRLVSLDPDRFAKQLIYHASNNKQLTKKKGQFVNANEFFGQLLTVRNDAVEVMQNERNKRKAKRRPKTPT